MSYRYGGQSFFTRRDHCLPIGSYDVNFFELHTHMHYGKNIRHPPPPPLHQRVSGFRSHHHAEEWICLPTWWVVAGTNTRTPQRGEVSGDRMVWPTFVSQPNGDTGLGRYFRCALINRQNSGYLFKGCRNMRKAISSYSLLSTQQIKQRT